MTGPLVMLIVFAIAGLVVAAVLLAEVDYEARRDVRRLREHEAARRRLSSPRSLP